MSFGGFKFGSGSTSTPNSTQPAAVPSFSLTGPSPAATTSQPFSFGAQPTQNAQGQGTSAPPSSAAGTGGGLFGSTTQQQQPQQQNGGGGGGLFGSFGAKPAQPTSSTGGGGGGLFGAANIQSSQTQPQQAPNGGGGGGLFGGLGGLGGQSTNNNTGQSSTGGLFGSQQQPQQQQSTGLFGSTNQQQPALFGSTAQQPQQQQQQQQQGGLFGGQTNTVGGLQLGGSTSTNNNQSQGSSGGMTKTTKFTDLPEQHQKMLEQLDSAFKQQKQLVYGTLDKQQDLSYAIRQVIQDVKSAEAETTALDLGLAPLRRACETLSGKVRSEEEDLQRLADIWGSYRPTDGRPSSLRAGALRDFRKQYFRKVVADSEERIPRYKKTISELRRAVESMQSSNDVPSPQAIAQTIQNHQNAIYTLAAQVEGLEVRWNDVRAFYSQMYKDKTGSIRDPLDVARERKGLPPLRS